MKKYVYVSKKEYGPVKNELIDLIHLVQKEVKQFFTFDFTFIGSASRNMITKELNGNIGYDFDVNIQINDHYGEFKPKEIRKILKAAFDKHADKFSYSNAEDSTRVLTIKVKERNNSRIIHSCDFAVVDDFQDKHGNVFQAFIYYNKRQNTYEWQRQPDTYYQQEKRVSDIKEAGLWQEVRELYLEKKCLNNDPHKKSRSIFAETINEIYNKYLGD